MNRQIGQLVPSQRVIQLHLQHQQNLLRAGEGAGRIRTQSGQKARLRDTINFLGLTLSTSAHEEVAQVRDKARSWPQ